MSETTSTSEATQTPTVTTVTATTTVTPGWRTTEFWLSSAAKLLGILFASGIIGEGTIYERVAGMAVTLLAAFGYTVSRGMVKAAAALLLVCSLGATQPACTKQQVASGVRAGGVCDRPGIMAAVGELYGWAFDRLAAAIAGGKVDSAKLRAAMTNVIDASPRCAIEAVIASMATETGGSSFAPTVDGAALRAEYDRLRAEMWAVR